jgi:DNA-binding response OmpR family regulator
VEHSQAVHHGGTGIGLAYAKELVELHGGHIFVESDYGKGTTFVLKLPLDPQIQPKPATEKQSKPADLSVATLEDGQNGFQEAATISSEADQQPEDEEIILVVDDSPDMRMYIRDCLEPDFRVIDAEDGKKGFHQAVIHIPDLIIADVMMPEMDGFQLCRCLKDDERTSHIPVIMLTARAGEEDKISGLLTGADDYLVKPFSKRELVVRIRNLIRIRRRLWERFRSMKAVIKPSEIIAASIDQQFLKKVVHIVEEHMDDPEFSVEELSRHLGMSRSQVHRKLTGLTGLSASKFIRWVRLARAADLLQKNAGNLAEIAYRVGFNSQSYFIKCFKEQFGCSPSEYRKSVSCR